MAVREKIAAILAERPELAQNHNQLSQLVGCSRERVRQILGNRMVLAVEHRCIDCGAPVRQAKRCMPCAGVVRQKPLELVCERCHCSFVITGRVAISYRRYRKVGHVALFGRQCPNCTAATHRHEESHLCTYGCGTLITHIGFPSQLKKLKWVCNPCRQRLSALHRTAKAV